MFRGFQRRSDQSQHPGLQKCDRSITWSISASVEDDSVDEKRSLSDPRAASHRYRPVYTNIALVILGLILVGLAVATPLLLRGQDADNKRSAATSSTDDHLPVSVDLATNDPSPIPTSMHIDPSHHPSESPTSLPIDSVPELVLFTERPMTRPAQTTTPPIDRPTPNPTSTPTSSPTMPTTNQPTTLATANPSITLIPTISIEVSPSDTFLSFFDTTEQPVEPPTISITAQPTSPPLEQAEAAQPPLYHPGNLTTYKDGLLLSEGLDVRILGRTDQIVELDLGLGSSQLFFHDQPDAGATYPDTDAANNPNGWIYVSNAEVNDGQGGVAALKFDQDGNLMDYTMLLTGTSMNCGGGRTPWNSWVSCEEQTGGQMWQVDPTGIRSPQLMSMGSEGGVWESFTFDVRNRAYPRFFVTEDHQKGALRRFTPRTANWEEPWNMLHDEGVTDFLTLFPNATNNGGTFQWTDDFDSARENADLYYPHSEGIDVYGSQLFFVCKKIHMLFVLDLDNGTYMNRTTKSGLFDGQPDQIQRILGDSRGDLIYFTEEGGEHAGIHARDSVSRFYTILESPLYPDETTGLAFSPDGRFMLMAYQDIGVLFSVWRKDGLPFYATHLDVKYHQS